MNKMSSAKVRCRDWTTEETELFANVLAEEDNQFAASLERLALKKAANNEVFDIKKFLIERRILKTKTKKETFAIRSKI